MPDSLSLGQTLLLWNKSVSVPAGCGQPGQQLPTHGSFEAWETCHLCSTSPQVVGPGCPTKLWLQFPKWPAWAWWPGLLEHLSRGARACNSRASTGASGAQPRPSAPNSAPSKSRAGTGKQSLCREPGAHGPQPSGGIRSPLRAKLSRSPPSHPMSVGLGAPGWALRPRLAPPTPRAAYVCARMCGWILLVSSLLRAMCIYRLPPLSWFLWGLPSGPQPLTQSL